jgi:hypothetical protein
MGKRLMTVALLASATLALAVYAGCSSSHTDVSGVYGIAINSPGGLQSAPTTPSPLPGGFGDSDMLPCARQTVVIEATGVPQADRVVTRVRTDSRGIFRISLPPGSYIAYGPGFRYLGTRFTVRGADYTRVRVIPGVIN